MKVRVYFMPKSSNNKTKKTAKRVITILFLGIIVLFVFNIFINLYQGHKKVERLEAKMNKLNTEIAKLNKETDELEKKVKYINSKQSIEEIARKELGLVKENELLYVIVEE